VSPESQPGAPAVTRRPGRPAKRERIVAAATAVFLRHGYADTTIEAIAAEAGTSKQTIYNHFDGKEQLFSAAIHAVQERGTAESAAAFAAHFAETGDLDHDLRLAFRLITQLISRGEVAAFRRLVIAEQLRHPELMDEWTQPRPGFEQAFAGEVGRQAALGTIEVDDPVRAARQLTTLVFTEAVSRSRYGLRPLSDAEIGVIVDEGVDLWLRAYRTR
jgi:TetR/AcrR family transcriptional repressor of mexJK operon